MIRAVNLTEKCVRAKPCAPVTVPPSASTTVLEDIVSLKGEEISGRYIFNACADNLYYAFGQDCDNVLNWHGYMAPGQQLDCSNHGMEVNVFSLAGGVATPTILRRQDLTQPQTFAQ